MSSEVPDVSFWSYLSRVMAEDGFTNPPVTGEQDHIWMPKVIEYVEWIRRERDSTDGSVMRPT